MLREAELISVTGRTVPPVFSARVHGLLARRGAGALTVFPLSDAAVEGAVG